jgi:hypothetical protein
VNVLFVFVFLLMIGAANCDNDFVVVVAFAVERCALLLFCVKKENPSLVGISFVK